MNDKIGESRALQMHTYNTTVALVSNQEPISGPASVIEAINARFREFRLSYHSIQEELEAGRKKATLNSMRVRASTVKFNDKIS